MYHNSRKHNAEIVQEKKNSVKDEIDALTPYTLMSLNKIETVLDLHAVGNKDDIWVSLAKKGHPKNMTMTVIREFQPGPPIT